MLKIQYENLLDQNLSWLLESNPWTEYNTLKNLLEIDRKDSKLLNARSKILKDIKINEVIQDLKHWYPISYTRHDDPKISHYKLMMLAEFGLNIEDPELNQIADAAKKHLDNSFFAMKQSLPIKGESTTEGWHALPCDSPIITYTLLLLEDKSKPVQKSIDAIVEKWTKPEGWFCDLFFVKSQFKKLNAACPMAGLMALQVFSQIEELKESESANNAFKALQFHKDYKKSLYYFGRSKKFWSFKYPFVWYNALYMADVISKYPRFMNSELFIELSDWLTTALKIDGKIKPTSMFRIYKEWDFADKKNYSPWMTYIALRILKRLKDVQ